MTRARTVGLVLIPILAGGWAGPPPAAQLAPLVARLDVSLEPLRLSAEGFTGGFERAPAPFSLTVRGDPVPHAIFFSVALPGEILNIEFDPEDTRPALTYSGGNVLSTDETGWYWESPREPGTYALRLSGDDPAQSIHLNLFVLRPASEVSNGVLNGYRIGSYRSIPLRGDSIYIPPPGFMEVPPEMADILVSPHFTVGQFLCKQDGNPKYLALSRYLVVKLEGILDAANSAGYSAPTLHVMSGYRTPWYNQLIGNQTDYSRHLWGGAADVFLDADRNGLMDDLNGDGASTIQDARILQDLAEAVDAADLSGTRPGGLSAYRRNSLHGPFLHVDARGQSARW